MKRCLLICLVILMLTACSKAPFAIDDQHKKYGEKALEIADKFLDYDLSLDEAAAKLEDLTDMAGSLPNVSKNDENRFGNERVVARVDLLETQFNLAMIVGLEKQSAEILDARNSLAEILGTPSR